MYFPAGEAVVRGMLPGADVGISDGALVAGLRLHEVAAAGAHGAFVADAEVALLGVHPGVGAAVNGVADLADDDH
jgi:hypothetical protein